MPYWAMFTTFISCLFVGFWQEITTNVLLFVLSKRIINKYTHAFINVTNRISSMTSVIQTCSFCSEIFFPLTKWTEYLINHWIYKSLNSTKQGCFSFNACFIQKLQAPKILSELIFKNDAVRFNLYPLFICSFYIS